MSNSKIYRLLRLKYVQIALLIFVYYFFSKKINFFHKSVLYSLAICIKSVIVWGIPITVAAYIAHTVKSFGKNAVLFLVLLMLFEFTSNYVSIWFTYGASQLLISNFASLPTGQETPSLDILFTFPISKPWWYSADKGLILGIFLGFLCDSATIQRCKSFADFILGKIFASLVPFFVLGMYINMDYRGVVSGLVTNYGLLVFLYTVIILVYSLLIYFIGAGFCVKQTFINLKNMIPAWLVGFTTGCSMSTMPLTIECTKKNLKEKSLAASLIPATTNIQQIGDCIMMSFVGCYLYSYYFGHLPDLYDWFKFSMIYTLARFTVTAVVGGAIFILLPIFEKFLGFSSEMSVIFLTINMVLDPVVTAFNILSNGGMAIIFEKLTWLFTGSKRFQNSSK